MSNLGNAAFFKIKNIEKKIAELEERVKKLEDEFKETPSA